MPANKPGKKTTPRPVPIVIVPDKTYIDNTGNVIPTDVLLIADPIMYKRMSNVLAAWGREPLGIPGQRGVIIEG